MSGNVSEWVYDNYDQYAYSNSNRKNNPVVASGSQNRVYRGGSWNSQSRVTRSANRFGISPGAVNSNTGFRLVFTNFQ